MESIAKKEYGTMSGKKTKEGYNEDQPKANEGDSKKTLKPYNNSVTVTRIETESQLY